MSVFLKEYSEKGLNCFFDTLRQEEEMVIGYVLRTTKGVIVRYSFYVHHLLANSVTQSFCLSGLSVLVYICLCVCLSVSFYPYFSFVSLLWVFSGDLT